MMEKVVRKPGVTGYETGTLEYNAVTVTLAYSPEARLYSYKHPSHS